MFVGAWGQGNPNFLNTEQSCGRAHQDHTQHAEITIGHHIACFCAQSEQLGAKRRPQSLAYSCPAPKRKRVSRSLKGVVRTHRFRAWYLFSGRRYLMRLERGLLRRHHPRDRLVDRERSELAALAAPVGPRYAVRTARPRLHAYRTVRPRLARVLRARSAWGPGASCPAPQVRAARRRLVRVASTFSTEAPSWAYV